MAFHTSYTAVILSYECLCCVQTSVQDALAALEVDTEQPEPAQFALNFLWLNKNIAVAVDQLFDEVSPSCRAVCLLLRRCCRNM